MPIIQRHWIAGSVDRGWLATPRDDLIREAPVSGDSPGELHFDQVSGPLARYRRTITDRSDGSTDETITYRVGVPWFGWVFGGFVHRALRHRPSAGVPAGRQPWWAPPDRLDHAHVVVLGLLAAAAMTSAFTNTLFTQTAGFAADTFGIDNSTQADAGTVVRLAIIVGLPFALAADRVGRRRMIQITAFAAPAVCSLGALAPSFGALTASQAVGRSIGLVLDLLVAVMAAEVMPRNSRAYAVSVLAMASGLGAGICVMSLSFADVSPEGWRWAYAVALVWLVVAVDLARRLPETDRFQRQVESVDASARRRVHIGRGRIAAQAATLFFANMFVAPASFFQNRYLEDVRGYSGGGIAVFTLVTQTPAGIGILIGGRIADRHGRRLLGAVCTALGSALVLISFAVAGGAMWGSALIGGIVGGMSVPALLVYRAEVFPTAKRSLAGYWVTAVALVSGSIGLTVTGRLLDAGWSHARVLAMLGLGQIVAAVIVLTLFPETAHRELEELNPQDAALTPPGPRPAA